eukprot:1703383-Pleurochrysis_carterae.AAC.2
MPFFGLPRFLIPYLAFLLNLTLAVDLVAGADVALASRDALPLTRENAPFLARRSGARVAAAARREDPRCQPHQENQRRHN